MVINKTSISFETYKVDENNYQGRGKEKVAFDSVALTLDGDTYKLPKDIGFNMQIDQQMNDFGTSVKNKFVDFRAMNRAKIFKRPHKISADKAPGGSIKVHETVPSYIAMYFSATRSMENFSATTATRR